MVGCAKGDSESVAEPGRAGGAGCVGAIGAGVQAGGVGASQFE